MRVIEQNTNKAAPHSTLLPHRSPFDECLDVWMTFGASKEASLGGILPQDAVHLLRVVQDELIVRF